MKSFRDVQLFSKDEMKKDFSVSNERSAQFRRFRDELLRDENFKMGETFER